MIKTNKKQTYEYVLNRVINDGIKAVEKDYTRLEAYTRESKVRKTLP